MERYIGIDVHAANCTMAVVSETGRRLRSAVVETSGESLVGAVRSVAGRRHVVLEESTQAGWLADLLERQAVEVVVTAVEQRRGQKNDEEDAYELAERLREGRVRRIYKQEGQYRELRQLARVYRMPTGDVVRVKNRVKSVYRSRGVPVEGRGVYSPGEREDWLERLDRASRLAAGPLLEELDALEDLRKKAEVAMVAESHRHPVSRRLETAPGMGPIRVAQVLPLVGTPHRFGTKRQFWSYCGMGIVMRSSSDRVRKENDWVRAEVAHTRGLNKQANLSLKAVFEGAAVTVVRSLPRDPLHAHYERLLENGTKPDLARLTVARRIAAITLALWKNEEEYDPRKTASIPDRS